MPIAIQFLRVEVDAIVSFICEAFFLEFLDELDLLGNVIGRFTPNRGHLDIECSKVCFEGLVYSSAISHADLPIRLAPSSILSSPVSASEVK